jgi:hypothetical protein
VEKNASQALQSFLMAAGFDPENEEPELGGWPIVPEACYMAGMMLCLGEGIPGPDFEHGIPLLKKAAELGIENAGKLLEKLEK